jgi:hypothetical protein
MENESCLGRELCTLYTHINDSYENGEQNGSTPTNHASHRDCAWTPPQGITSQKGTPAEESRSRIETIPPLEAEYCGGSNVETSAAAEHTCSLCQSLIIRHIGEQLSNLTQGNVSNTSNYSVR